MKFVFQFDNKNEKRKKFKFLFDFKAKIECRFRPTDYLESKFYYLVIEKNNLHRSLFSIIKL